MGKSEGSFFQKYIVFIDIIKPPKLKFSMKTSGARGRQDAGGGKTRDLRRFAPRVGGLGVAPRVGVRGVRFGCRLVGEPPSCE